MANHPFMTAIFIFSATQSCTCGKVGSVGSGVFVIIICVCISVIICVFARCASTPEYVAFLAALLPIIVSIIIVASPKDKDKVARNISDFQIDQYFIPRFFLLSIFLLSFLIALIVIITLYCFTRFQVRRIGGESSDKGSRKVLEGNMKSIEDEEGATKNDQQFKDDESLNNFAAQFHGGLNLNNINRQQQQQQQFVPPQYGQNIANQGQPQRVFDIRQAQPQQAQVLPRTLVRDKKPPIL